MHVFRLALQSKMEGLAACRATCSAWRAALDEVRLADDACSRPGRCLLPPAELPLLGLRSLWPCCAPDSAVGHLARLLAQSPSPCPQQLC